MKKEMTNTTTHEKWKDLGFKDKAQYIMALSFAAASIILAFLAFILLMYIPTSVITMSSLFASFAMGIIAGGLYFKNQLMELNIKTEERLKELDMEIEDRLKMKE